MVKTNARGEREIIVKKGTKIRRIGSPAKRRPATASALVPPTAWRTDKSSTCPKMKRRCSSCRKTAARRSHGHRVCISVRWCGGSRVAPDARPPAGSRALIRLAYVFSDGNMPGTLEGVQVAAGRAAGPPGRVALTFLTESLMSDVKADGISRRTCSCWTS